MRETEALAVKATLDVLAGSIAHEINRPLTAIITNAETVLHSVQRGQTLPADVIEQLRALLHKEKAR